MKDDLVEGARLAIRDEDILSLDVFSEAVAMRRDECDPERGPGITRVRRLLDAICIQSCEVCPVDENGTLIVAADRPFLLFGIARPADVGPIGFVIDEKERVASIARTVLLPRRLLCTSTMRVRVEPREARAYGHWIRPIDAMRISKDARGTAQ